MNLHKTTLLAGIGLCLLGACKDKKEEASRTVFFDKAGMDTTVVPGNDFFSYANGGWVKNTPIPGDQTGWGSFYTLYQENQKKTRTLLERAAAAKADKGSIEQKVGDFYASGMDTVTIEKLAYEPLKPELAKIAALKDYKQVLNYLAADETNRGGALFGMYIGPDDRRSNLNRMNFSQAGLSLPEREYYFKTDEETKKVRTAFVRYITKLFTLTGLDSVASQKKADAILAFETAIAKSHKAPADLRDPIKNYHKYSVAELTKLTPNIDWKPFLATMTAKTDTVLVGQPEYYQALSSLLATTPIEVIKDKLAFNFIDDNASLLSAPFVQARFEFKGKILSGQQQLSERWKRVADNTDTYLGELLGQSWVKEYFTPEAKERMLTLVNNLQKAYRTRIEKLDWMSEETKKIALVKLDDIIKKIGYPDKWKDYSDVDINRNDYFGNVQRARKHEWKESLGKVEKEVDKTEWQMTPPTVNAYANPTFNEIVFPAGILQFPFFDKDADDAINYGGIGMVIGHEMTHLFDDQGRQYDPKGNLRDWWKKEDADKFTTKTNQVVDQYNKYTVLNNLNLNGRLTLGENLADLGGLAISYDAFKLTEQGKSNEKIDGFTPDQRFFLGYAQIWRSKIRDEAQRVRVQTDPHSPAKFRVNGPLTNFAPFYRAFNVQSGQRLYKPEVDQTRVW
ncbi:M13 family metallopeptidase [Tellurirhabdus bombi]|uniref:M13 family metallopeptidase n=1 Tax=Tellurirhabdus bombi TaxID=2907205 RepID=UPI001F41E2EC|nr:M13 family metallopeptidase [Tellurirhabdus bombi]